MPLSWVHRRHLIYQQYFRRSAGSARRRCDMSLSRMHSRRLNSHRRNDRSVWRRLVSRRRCDMPLSWMHGFNIARNYRTWSINRNAGHKKRRWRHNGSRRIDPNDVTAIIPVMDVIAIANLNGFFRERADDEQASNADQTSCGNGCRCAEGPVEISYGRASGERDAGQRDRLNDPGCFCCGGFTASNRRSNCLRRRCLKMY